MNKKWLNIPLLVFFGLCYGLGHPSAASYRPASMEKSLTGFHEETNRLALGFYGMFKYATEERKRGGAYREQAHDAGARRGRSASAADTG